MPVELWSEQAEEITRAQLKQITRQALQQRVPDAIDAEIETLVSAIRTSFALRAVRLALEARRCGKGLQNVGNFESRRGFDFAEFRRTSLVDQLDAASGLGFENCSAVIEEIEALVATELQNRDTVRFDDIGMLRLEGDSGFHLFLAPDLCVPFRSAE